MSSLETTSTVQLQHIEGARVRCTHPECNIPASHAIVAPMGDGLNMRLYEMQPYCIYHYLKLKRTEGQPNG